MQHPLVLRFQVVLGQKLLHEEGEAAQVEVVQQLPQEAGPHILREEDLRDAEDLQHVVAILRAAHQDLTQGSQGLVLHSHTSVGVLDELLVEGLAAVQLQLVLHHGHEDPDGCGRHQPVQDLLYAKLLDVWLAGELEVHLGEARGRRRHGAHKAGDLHTKHLLLWLQPLVFAELQQEQQGLRQPLDVHRHHAEVLQLGWICISVI
mmetsp:Transcript_132259/g.313530  ORF Transcript_132259/g.313530 Transcript_132259/m.313530 type:complete len:205 (+) Transcript_132259:346-960(+)